MKRMAEDIVGGMLKFMDAEASMEFFDDGDEGVLIHVTTPEASRLIGKEARTLNALQFLANRMAQKQDPGAPRIVLDVEHYRERRKDRLLSRALSYADEVEETGESLILEPMNAAERRIVHQAIAKREGVRTYSVEGHRPGEKQVVIEPVDE